MTSDSEDGNGEPIKKGACRKRWRRFTIQEKAAIIRTVERLMQQHGMMCCKACEDLNVTSGMHWAWKQKIDAMLEAKSITTSRQNAPHTSKNYCNLSLNSVSKEWQCQFAWWRWELLNCLSNFIRNQGLPNITQPEDLSVVRGSCFVLGRMDQNVRQRRLLLRPWIIFKMLPGQRCHKNATDTKISFWIWWIRFRFYLHIMQKAWKCRKAHSTYSKVNRWH